MYEDWIAKDKAVERTGLTARTLERMVNAGKLRREYVHIPGRKALPVFEPIGIEQLESQTLKPAPATKAKTTRHISTKPTVVISWSLADKEYLTLKEAAFLKGVPVSYLLRKIKSGELPAGKLAGWRIHRDTLRQHRILPLLLPPPETKTLKGQVAEQPGGESR